MHSHRPAPLLCCTAGKSRSASGSSSGAGSGLGLSSNGSLRAAVPCRNFLARSMAFSRGIPEKGCFCFCSISRRIWFSSRSLSISSEEEGEITCQYSTSALLQPRLSPNLPILVTIANRSRLHLPADISLVGGGETDTHDTVLGDENETPSPRCATSSSTCRRSN